MADDAQQIDASLYEQDFHAWLMAQAAEIRARRAAGLDWDNLAEEVESLGRAQKNEIRSRLARLLQHLLKWAYQPERRSHSWQSTISGQRLHIAGVIEDSPSLKHFPGEVLAKAYDAARRLAIDETGLAPDRLPSECPWEIDAILDRAFMPGPPWSPEDLKRD